MSDVLNLVKMVFGRGVIRSVKDAGARQQAQLEMLKDEVIDDVEHMQNYGFTSHPTGGDCAVAFNGGNREQGIVLVIDDRRYRIPLLGGEVAMYDDLGNKIELLREMRDAAARIEGAVEAVLAEGAVVPRDLGGDARCSAITDAILRRLG